MALNVLEKSLNLTLPHIYEPFLLRTIKIIDISKVIESLLYLGLEKLFEVVVLNEAS